MSGAVPGAVGPPVPDDAGPPMTWSLGTSHASARGSVTVSGTVLNTAVNGDAVTFDASIATGSLIVDTDATDNSDSDQVVVDTPPTVTINQAAARPTRPTRPDRLHGGVQRAGDRIRGQRRLLRRSTAGGTLVGRHRRGPTYNVPSPA